MLRRCQVNLAAADSGAAKQLIRAESFVLSVYFGQNLLLWYGSGVFVAMLWLVYCLMAPYCIQGVCPVLQSCQDLLPVKEATKADHDASVHGQLTTTNCS